MDHSGRLVLRWHANDQLATAMQADLTTTLHDDQPERRTAQKYSNVIDRDRL